MSNLTPSPNFPSICHICSQPLTNRHSNFFYCFNNNCPAYLTTYTHFSFYHNFTHIRSTFCPIMINNLFYSFFIYKDTSTVNYTLYIDYYPERGVFKNIIKIDNFSQIIPPSLIPFASSFVNKILNLKSFS